MTPPNTGQDTEQDRPQPPPQLVGHGALLAQLYAEAKTNKLHHGWILTGPAGIGKARLALEFAAQLIAATDTPPSLFGASEGDGAPDAPALDETERHLVYQRTHPDLLYISADRTEANKSGQIRIEQIRSVAKFTSTSSARGGWRVVIIDTLDDVNRNGANALLKVLEEPPEKTILLLISSAPGRILPTIRSRCRLQTVPSLSVEACIEVLSQLYEEADPAYLSSLARLSDGAPGQALSLSEAGAIEAYEASCHILAHERAHLDNLMKLAEIWGGSGARSAPMRRAGRYLFDRLWSQAALAATAPSLINPHLLAYEQETISALARDFSADMLANFHQEMDEMFQSTSALYLDATAVFQPFLFKIHSQS